MGDPVTMKYSDTRLDTLQAMRQNVFTFVAFKNHRRTSDIVDLLEVNGKLRPKSDFVREARLISEDYNKNWLTAEYDTVVASGQTAAQWKDFERNKNLLPFLLYKTQADSRVRDSHSVLHDVCKPIEDPFWDEFYPPNGWRCRCYVLQVAKREGKEDPESEPSAEEVKPIFRNNPGKSGVIFTQDHNYFAGMEKDVKTNILTQMRKILVKEPIWNKEYQSAKSGETIEAHITHDGQEKKINLETAKVFADHGEGGQLLEVDRSRKNLDWRGKDGAYWEFKDPGPGQRSLKNAFKDSMQKSTTERPLHNVALHMLKGYDYQNLRVVLNAKFGNHPNLQVVRIIKDQTIYEVRRDNLREDISRLPK